MRSLGRVVAVLLFGGSVFVGCVVSPQAGRMATRELDASLGRAAVDKPEPVPPSFRPKPPAQSAVTNNGVAVAGARVNRAPRAASGAAPRAQRAPRSPSPERAQPSAPQWERMVGEVGNGPYTVGRATGSGIFVSVNPGDHPSTELKNPTPNGSQRVVLVLGESGDWLKVLLPIRPNGSVGWVNRHEVALSSHGFHVVVEQNAHRIRVYDNGGLIVDEPVGVGKGKTPTPTGQFYATDLLQPPNPDGAYGPYAFGLSAYSDVYQRFGSGDGVVGIHGTNDPSSVGRDASNGCIRVTNDTIRYLASILPLGTPVAIRP